MNTEEAVARFFAAYPPNTVVLQEESAGSILFISGSLDLQYSKDLQDMLVWLIDRQEGKRSITVDLSEINYISSTGVGALAYAMVRASKRDLSFKLRNIQPKVRSVFELLGLMKFFQEV